MAALRQQANCWRAGFSEHWKVFYQKDTRTWQKEEPPRLPVSSLGFRNAHVVLIKQDSEICWVKIKCIVFHKYQNANSL